MAMIPWKKETSRDPLVNLHQEMDRWFQDFFGNDRNLLATSMSDITPAIDIWETKDALCAKIEVPGLDPKDIEVNVSGDVLTISGEKKKEELTENDNYIYQERRYGSFRRTFRLPSWANPEKVDASHKNGTLEFSIAKKETAKPKNVQVKVKG